MRRGGGFQSTLPCGERPYDDDNSSILLPFQSTLPCGERLKSCTINRDSDAISIHAPVWGATSRTMRRLRLLMISIHAPVWGATIALWVLWTVQIISIHAPVWGATSVGKARRRISDISIHAPVWGATRHLIDDKINHRISIHAPVWGATGSRRYRPRQIKDFNPRSRVGSDCKRAQTTRFLSVPVRHFLHKRKQNIRCSTFILPQSRAFSRHFSARKSGAFYGRFPFAHFSLSLISNKATRSASGFALLIQGKIHFFH